MNKTIGNNIAKFRKNIGMTQSEMAEKLNVSVQAVSKWENDISYPDLERIGQLAEVLNTSAESIINGKEDVPETKLKSDIDFSKLLLLVNVNVKSDKSVDLTLRIPVELFLKARENGTINLLMGEFGEDLPESALDTVFEMITAGVVGPIVNINADNTSINIEVVEYDH